MLKYLILILLFKSCLCLNSSIDIYESNLIFKKHVISHYGINEKYSYEIVKKIYNSSKQTYFTFTFCNFGSIENEIIKKIQSYDNGYPVIINNGCQNKTRKVIPRHNIHGKTTYLVTLSTMSKMNDIITTLKMTGIFQRRSTVIFIFRFPVELNNYLFHNMKSNFQLLWSRGLMYSVFIMWSEKLKMYSYNNYLDELKDVTDVKDISGFLNKQHHNLYGHEVRLSVFSKIYITYDNGLLFCKSKLTKTVMKYLNATCKPIVTRDGNTVGDLLDNGTATGVTADLMDGYTDLELNSRILKTSYYGYIDTTYPVLQDKLCFLVLNLGIQSTILTVLNLISIPILFLFIAILIVLIVISILLRKFESKIIDIEDQQSTGSILMDLIKCFIKESVILKYPGPVFRCLTLSIMLYSLIVNCVIEGIITSAIAYPRYKGNMNTWEIIKNKNLILGIHNRDYKIFRNSFSTSVFTSINDRIEIFSDQKVKKVIDERQFQYATLLRKSEADQIVNRQKNVFRNRPLFHVAAPCPVPCFIVNGLRYGSPYLNRIKYILRNLYQAGIIQYWMNSDLYPQSKTFIHKMDHRKPLGMKHMQEVFLHVYFVGVLISIITFVIEILIHKIRR